MDLKQRSFDFNKNFCKNFIILLVFLKFLKKMFFKKSGLGVKCGIFIKPLKKNIFNYLRAPYKNKLSRNQLFLPRYKFSVVVTVFYGGFYKRGESTSYIFLINFFKKNLICVESNITYLHRVGIAHKSVITNY
jgi:hypothetical protein